MVTLKRGYTVREVENQSSNPQGVRGGVHGELSETFPDVVVKAK